ncbi:MAG: GDP-mannose 4,6-dehydratase [Thermoplasmata archaeon]|nr:MAG: GDP-mannose 4,6-dehydratase [Thermoplasmata archaeon]
MKNKKIVITGGLGFIGSNLAHSVCEENEVVILDDISSGKLDNIHDLIKGEQITFVEGNIRDQKLLSSAFEGAEYVFHLAAIPSVATSIENPILTTEVNLRGTMNVLLASRDSNVKKVVFASSAAVYGNLTTVPLTENMPPYPASPYGAQKLGGEHYFRVFYEVYGIATTSLRCFNVFGPKQDPESEYSPVIPKFIFRVSKNSPPIIYGDGMQTRDFIYVEDVVRANILAAENTASNGKTINIASGKETSINDLASIIVTQMGKELEPVHAEARDGEIIRSFADITVAKQLLDFEPVFSLKEGLEKTIEFFNKRT